MAKIVLLGERFPIIPPWPVGIKCRYPECLSEWLVESGDRCRHIPAVVYTDGRHAPRQVSLECPVCQAWAVYESRANGEP